MSFSVDVSKWVERTGDTVEQASADVMLALFRGVILDTPVLEGHLRGNWIPTKGSPAEASAPLSPDPTGNNSLNRVTKFMGSQDLQDDFSIYLTNNLPYAHRIEYGWSTIKAPEGMVRKNVKKIQNKLL